MKMPAEYRKFDEKSRIILPNYNKVIGSCNIAGIVGMKETDDRFLMVAPKNNIEGIIKDWYHIGEKITDIYDRKTRNDEDRRLSVPSNLTRDFELKGKIYVIQFKSHYELWNIDKYRALEKRIKSKKDKDEIAKIGL